MIHIAADPEELAASVADRTIAEAKSAIEKRGRCVIAVAGGSTPKAMNALLARAPRRDEVDWARVVFFFGDERCVPPDHPDSNYRMTRETLFDPLGIAPENVFRMHGEDEPAAAASAYAEVLRRELGDAPVFDIIHLGMGPDGHTASLFPGTLDQIRGAALVAAPFVAKFNSHRITLTPRVINAARAVVIATAGEEKAAALHDVFDDPRDPNVHPIELVAPKNGTLDWFVDRAAVAHVERLAERR